MRWPMIPSGFGHDVPSDMKVIDLSTLTEITDIRTGPGEMEIHCNAGTTSTNQVGDLSGIALNLFLVV